MGKLEVKPTAPENIKRAMELTKFLITGQPPSGSSLRSLFPAMSASRKIKSKKIYPAPSLEEICKGDDEKRKRDVAERIDAVWEALKNKIPQRQHPAACVALYKVAVFLHKIEDHHSVKASDWRRTLEGRYGVQISEGIAKYQLEKPKSDVFVKAARLAFALFKAKYPHWVKVVDLPTIYQ